MGSANRSRGSTKTKPTKPPRTIVSAKPMYEPPKPKIRVNMTTNTTNQVKMTMDPETAQTILRSVTTTLKRLQGGVEWASERKRLTYVAEVLRNQGVTS